MKGCRYVVLKSESIWGCFLEQGNPERKTQEMYQLQQTPKRERKETRIEEMAVDPHFLRASPLDRRDSLFIYLWKIDFF